jgi:[acyl-carrier-protein] S-malonyltransferase
MGGELAERWPAARAVYETADATLGWSVSARCFEGPEEALNETRSTQPCLLATEIAALAALRAELPDPAPALVAGHSVGEYAALVAANVLDLPDALRLVARRAELMAAAASGGMTAVIGLDRETVAAVLARVAGSEELTVANDNAPGQVVISGSDEALAAVTEPLREAGARRLVPLKVSGAFHSPAMRAAGEELRAAFKGVTWHDPRIPVVSNVTAQPVDDAAEVRQLLARQVSSPVEWVASVRAMAAAGVDTFVECGPGTALTGMVRRIVPGARLANVSDAATLAAAVELLRQQETAPAEARMEVGA